MAALVDTNVLVYRFDGRFPEKQATADALLREGIESDGVRIAHQAVVEFVAATTRPVGGGRSILAPATARREAEELLRQFRVLHPDDRVVRAALQGWAAYGLSWWDAHMWAYAEVHELGVLWSEDFEHERWYGSVLVLNPFADRGRVSPGAPTSAR